MIPGITSKLSETVIASAASIPVKSDIVRLTGSTIVTTMVPGFAGFSGTVYIISVDGAVQFNTGGNIAKAALTVQFQVMQFVYSKGTGLWYPSAIS